MKKPSDQQPGTIVQLGEPEFVGRIPVRTELQVLSADNPTERTIGWVVQEFSGAEVTRPHSDESLTNENDIKEGDRLWVPMLFGTYEMTVYREGGKLYAETADSVAILEFAADSRKCWTTPGAFHKKALKRMTITLETSSPEEE